MTEAHGSKLPAAIKRVMDALIAMVGLLCATPLFLVLVITIRLDSPGPAFFVQTRIGRRGRKFPMIKFRSMFVDGDTYLQDPELRRKTESEGKVLKSGTDPRVTRAGRVLRTTSLDELPQLVNVLLGHMSLVGPRALIPSMLAPFPEWAKQRSVVRPGLTGLWQISARERNESLADMIDYDLDYIRKWSLWADAVILARTPGVVLSRKGAV